jgi:hypothetical protein
MMKQILLYTSTAFVALFGIALLAGCATTSGEVVYSPGAEVHAKSAGPPPHAPAHGYRRNHQYYYFPRQEVYFAVRSGTYFWFEGKYWKAGVSLPGHVRVDLDDAVTITLGTERPYERHKETKKKYPPGQRKRK